MILDVVMPGTMDGLEALAAFKKIDREVPVIVLSGQGRTTTGSVPGGDFAPAVAEAAARAGFTRLFTSEPTRDVRTIGGLELCGRFTVQRWTTAQVAAALAAGAWLPAARQVLVWNAKKLTKHLGGERYLRLRKFLLRHGQDVQWGDTA